MEVLKTRAENGCFVEKFGMVHRKYDDAEVRCISRVRCARRS